MESTPANVRVKADIQALNLNAARLRRGRWEAFEAYKARLEQAAWATAELKRIARECKISSGVRAPEHAEFVRYHVLKKLRSRGETE